MNTEQKAKAYDEAIKKVHKFIDGYTRREISRETLEGIFPELRESEDERIRKLLISGMKNLNYNAETFASIPIKDVIDWLEKQKSTDEEIVFRPLVGTDIRIAAKQSLEKLEIGKKVVLAFNGAYIPVYGKTVGEICKDYDTWLEKQKEPEFEDFGEYVTELNKQFPEVSFAKLSRIAVRVKNWLEKQGNQREQLINKACDVLVNCIEDYMLRRMEVWNEECKKQTLENIRKKLEE